MFSVNFKKFFLFLCFTIFSLQILSLAVLGLKTDIVRAQGEAMGPSLNPEDKGCCVYKDESGGCISNMKRKDCPTEHEFRVGDPSCRSYDKCLSEAEINVPLQVGIGDFKKHHRVPSLNAYIRNLYIWSIGAIGVLAVAIVMVGGFQWLTAAGNTARIGDAKSRIGSALIGLVLAMTSYLLLQTINPDLISLKGIKVLKVPIIPQKTATWPDVMPPEDIACGQEKKFEWQGKTYTMCGLGYCPFTGSITCQCLPNDKPEYHPTKSPEKHRVRQETSCTENLPPEGVSRAFTCYCMCNQQHGCSPKTSGDLTCPSGSKPNCGIGETTTCDTTTGLWLPCE